MDLLVNFLNDFLGNAWVMYATAIVTVFSAIVSLTPTPAEGSRWATVYKVFDWLALTVGRAKETGKK